MLKTKKAVRLLVPLALAGLVLAGCAGSETPDPGQTSDAPVADATLRANWGGGPESWAPGSAMESGYFRVPYETLLVLDADGQIAPQLATEWELTDEEVVFTIREGVKFHDGTDMDAAAVKTNIEYVRDNPGPFSGGLQVITDVVAEGDTVTVKLAGPTPSILSLFTQRNVPITSPAAIADGSIATNPVGTSPWKYDQASSVIGTKYSFLAFDDYWGEKPGFANIELYAIDDDTAATAALLNGELDVTDTEDTELPRLESVSEIDLITYPAIRNGVVFFDRGPGGQFESKELRQALCYSIDLQTHQSLDPTSVIPGQFFVPGDFGHIDGFTQFGFDPAEAQSLYEAAGSPTVSATWPVAPYNAQQSTIYAEGMNELANVNITIQEMPPPQWRSEWNNGQYPLGLGSHDEKHPFEWYSSWFAATGGSNPAGAESAELKSAADRAIAAGSSDEAEGLWHEVLKIIYDEALGCGWMVGQELVAVNTATVAGAASPVEAWEPNLINYRDLTPVR